MNNEQAKDILNKLINHYQMVHDTLPEFGWFAHLGKNYCATGICFTAKWWFNVNIAKAFFMDKAAYWFKCNSDAANSEECKKLLMLRINKMKQILKEIQPCH